MILVFAVVHFCLLMLAMANAFIIFRGPSTSSELFWDGAMRVLLSPANLLFDIVGNSAVQVILAVLNSLLWGAVAAFVMLRFRRPGRIPPK